MRLDKEPTKAQSDGKNEVEAAVKEKKIVLGSRRGGGSREEYLAARLRARGKVYRATSKSQKYLLDN